MSNGAKELELSLKDKTATAVMNIVLGRLGLEGIHDTPAPGTFAKAQALAMLRIIERLEIIEAGNFR